MTFVSVYLTDSGRLYETYDKINKSKNKFNDNSNVSSNNSNINAITSKISNLVTEIKEDYEKTSIKLNDYTNKVEDNERELASRVISELENNSVIDNIPIMVTDSSTGGELNSTIDIKLENKEQIQENNNSETLENIADEFFENQRKNIVFIGSTINSQRNNLSLNGLNSVKQTININPERIENAKINTDKRNERVQHQKNESKIPYILNNMSDSFNSVLKNPFASVGTIKNGVFSTAKIGGYVYSGFKSLFTGEKLSDVVNETIESISNIERKTDNELIGTKLFVTEGMYNAIESVVKGIAVFGSDTFINSSESKVNILERTTGQKYESTAKEKLENFLGTNWVNKGFNTFYEQTEFGNQLKENLIGFDTQRDIGTTVGSAIPTIAVGIATGGTGAMIAGGLSSAGSSATSALQEGATLNEATNYGTVKGALTATTFGLGKIINSLTPFGIGTTEKTLGNAGARVLADTGLGAVTGAVDSVLKQLYIPRNKLNELGFESESDWNNASFSKKYTAIFDALGGKKYLAKSTLTSAAYSIVFEGLSAVKEISAINSANKLYSEVAENNAKINNINNNMLAENNSPTTNALEDLARDRKKLESLYDNLDEHGKHYFNKAIEENKIGSGNVIDTKSSDQILIDVNNTNCTLSNYKNIKDNVSNGLKYKRTGTLKYSLNYLKSNINKFSYENTNTITGLNGQIKNNGLYHFTSAGDAILKSGYIKASGVNASYGNKKTFFFNGIPDVGSFASNLDTVPIRAEAIKINPTDEMINSPKLRIRLHDDKAISYDGDVNLVNLNAIKEYFCLFQEGDELVYKVVSKEFYDNYPNTSEGKKVQQLLLEPQTIQAIKEDYYYGLSLNSANASKSKSSSIFFKSSSQFVDCVEESKNKKSFTFLNIFGSSKKED